MTDAGFTKEDTLFLAENNFGLRHVHDKNHYQSHFTAPVMGDAIAISRIETLLSEDEKSETKFGKYGVS